MKKLLGILVLGLLWCNTGFVKEVHEYGEDICVKNSGMENFKSHIKYVCYGSDIVRKNDSMYDWYFDRLKKKHKVVGGPKKKKPEQAPDDGKIVAAASGSGFFVSRNGHIITNYHVIEDCNAVKVNYKGDEISAKILAVDRSNDLAIIKTKINPTKAYPVSRQDVTLLQDIVIAGFPLGKKVSAAIKANPGNVTSLAGYNDNFSNFQTNADINKGNSGGPIVDTKGNIVGVAVATWSEKGVQGIHFGIKSSTLITFASSNGVKFISPNTREMSSLDLGKLVTEATVFLECHMTVAKIKKLLAQTENRKAFYSEHK